MFGLTRMRLAGGCKLAACVVIVAVAATSAAAQVDRRHGARPTGAAIKPPHGRPFVPLTGDWEGVAGGFHASLALVPEPRYARLYRLPPYGLKDLVMLEPASCPASPSDYFESLVNVNRPSAVRRSGSFGLSSVGIRGGLTSARTAVVSVSYRVPPSGAAAGCSGELTWRLHPAHRVAVEDGQWRLHFSDGESQRFTVEAGGRLAPGVKLPQMLASCGGPTGDVDLFIAPSGTASYVLTHAISITLRFRGSRASGTMSVSAGDCSDPSFSMSASLLKRSS